VPAKKAIINIVVTFTEVKSEVLFRSAEVSSIVRPTKIGTVPSGFITEKSDANTYKKMSIVFAAKNERF
jgi:hypothetical protein